MSLNWKRILLVIGFVAAVLLLAYLLYFFLLRPSVPITTPTTTNQAPGTLPGTNENANIAVNANAPGTLPGANVNAGVPGPPTQPAAAAAAASTVASGGLTRSTALTDGRSYGSTLSGDGSSVQFYDRNSGLFMRVTADGRTTPLSDKIFFQVEQITWSPDKGKAVLEYPDGANILYDFTTKQQVTLPAHWKDFDFSPNGNELVFKSMGSGEESRWLSIAGADGSKAQKIEHLGDKDASVYPLWSPSDTVVALYSEDKDFDRQTLYFVGKNQENFPATIIEGRDFRGQWSPGGDQLLYSVYSSESGFRPTLWVVSAQGDNIGQNRRKLNLDTWVDKCTFSNHTTAYCAVPKNLPENAGIFAAEMDSSPADIYRIDLTTGLKSLVATPEGNHNIDQLIPSADGRYLYFTSKTDGRLYRIQLK